MARNLDVARMAKRWIPRHPSTRGDFTRERDLADFARQVARACARVAIDKSQYDGSYDAASINQRRGRDDAANAIRRALRRRPHGT